MKIILDHNALKTEKNSIYGCDPYNRSIDDHIRLGIINLDKQAGPSSHEVVAILKKVLEIDKAGHSGTLDPNVTGVLPIALQNATRVLSILLLAPKKYICNLYTKADHSYNEWQIILKNFIGIIYQVPPLKSNVVKKLRKRRIYDIQLIEVEANQILFEVTCQAGTYIRTLCEDIGRSIGQYTYMKELRRIQTGPFDEKSSVTMHNVFDAYEDYRDGLGEDNLRKVIKPVETAISHLSKIMIKESAIDAICHGVNLKLPGIIACDEFSKSTKIAIISPKKELIAIGDTLVNSKFISKNYYGIVVHPTKVIMARGTYPNNKNQ